MQKKKVFRRVCPMGTKEKKNLFTLPQSSKQKVEMRFMYFWKCETTLIKCLCTCSEAITSVVTSCVIFTRKLTPYDNPETRDTAVPLSQQIMANCSLGSSQMHTVHPLKGRTNRQMCLQVHFHTHKHTRPHAHSHTHTPGDRNICVHVIELILNWINTGI